MSNPSFSALEKVALIKRHLVEKVAVSDLCAEKSITPALFHQWLEQFFQNGAAAFDSGRGRGRGRPPKHSPEARVRELESKLAYKDEVLIELLSDHVALKKNLASVERPLDGAGPAR